MKKGISIAIIISILFSMSYFAVNAEIGIKNSPHLVNTSSDGCNQQDGRFISRLQWFSPNGELPGTYDEYLNGHPLKPARFSTSVGNLQSITISILVDEDLYPKIATGIEQYIADLKAEGYSVFLQAISGGTPEEIKEWITERYNFGSEGIILIGDITAAWAEVSESVFPCDLFYMDLDGNWEDHDGDGDYEIHTPGKGDMGPEVYVARIYAHTLTYDTDINMVNDYLAKTHAYRIGELNRPWRGLEYIDEDWYDMDVHLNLIYGNEVVRHDYGYYTTGEDYLDQMDLGQHFVQVCAHSYSGGHHFGTRPTESASYANIYVYSPIARDAKLLLGSDDGIKVWLNGENVYIKDRYGSWYEDRYEIDVILNEGWNRLLCKISQGGGDYEFSARFTDTNYNAFEDLEYRINNPDTHDSEAEFIRSWLLNGFHQDTSDNFWNYLTTNYLGINEGSIDPEEGEEMGGKIWTRYDSGCPYIDLSAHDDHNFGVTYAYARVYADSDKSCQLWMGYDDGARVWLNGEEILYDNKYGNFESDMTKANVTLNAGENRLLVKISEWMGPHGFGARFCRPDGNAVEGLIYNPEPTPIAHIGRWLVNGPYLNPDRATRLSTDYLGDEVNVTPSEGDPAPFGAWKRGIGNGCPFDLGGYFDHGDWVFSEDIQERDPPVLFYNLFACGPGRFTDENYLAGAYIFHTTYGLITVASSKSGSMLNFDDFYGPLCEDKSIGEAFREWFNAQAPFAQWEKEWYYGMVVCGDPTLRIIPTTKISITKPEKAIYIKNKKIIPFFTTVIIGNIDIKAAAIDPDGIERVEFYIEDDLKMNDTSAPYNWTWDEKIFLKFRYTIKAIAYDNIGNRASDEVTVWKFF